jgi:2,4-dienoyl-CoA reductase-like NADH-dependent reductase (Old Yellow Enzyme family)
MDFSGLDKLVTMMERGDFDLIAIGRALIANPDWANKVKAGKLDELEPFSPEKLATLV